MDGGSTIGVPNVPIALPNIPHGTRTEAQAASEGGGWVAAPSRSSRTQIIFEGALVYRARIGAGEALGAWAGLEGGLLGRGGQAYRGKRQATTLSVHSGRRDRAWVRLIAGLGGHGGLAAKKVVEGLATERSTSPIGCTGTRKRR